MLDLKCNFADCKHKWKYKGLSRFYATCPNCLRKTKVPEKYKQRQKLRQAGKRFIGLIE